MLSNLHILNRAAFLAALLGGSMLALPAVARAQSVTGERALMNRLDATSAGNAAVATHTPAAAQPAQRDAVDGARALLNRSDPRDQAAGQDPDPVQRASADLQPVNGIRALLNRSSL